MEHNFKRIENWLRGNARKIIEFSLQEPSTISDINNLEEVIGKNLPDDFKNLYFWHNGLNGGENFGSLFYGMDFFPIDRIIAEYHSKKENYSSETIALNKTDPEINPSDIYNMDWIRFAFDGSHTSLYLDLAPTGKGNYGQIIFIEDEYTTGILVANSTAQLVENFTNDLENNLYHLDEDALEDENHYLTTDPKIDIINWETSEIWKR